MFNLTKKSKIQSTSSMVKMLKINEQLQFQNKNKQFLKNILLTTGDNNKIMLSSILKSDKPKLVFFYSQLNCQVCVDTEIEKLKMFSKIIGIDNIVIICSYENRKEFLIFKKIHNLNLKIYNLGLKNKLGLPLENIIYLFYLWLIQNLELKIFSYPSKDFLVILIRITSLFYISILMLSRTTPRHDMT